MAITSKCDQCNFFIQLTSNQHGIVIYDLFLQLKCAITYAYRTCPFATKFIYSPDIKKFNGENLFTIW
jgi:hypothetical protein